MWKTKRRRGKEEREEKREKEGEEGQLIHLTSVEKSGRGLRGGWTP
jgi:hypothetical protein